jgi:hypothetical protein
MARVSQRQSRSCQRRRPVDARSRIGIGPWRNANGVLVARNLDELHSRTGDASLLIDETGRRINGQWAGSPAPVEHDILTGSNADGTLIPDKTCTRLDVAVVHHQRARGPFRRPWARRQRSGSAVVVEFVARQRELREYRSTRRRRATLLLRPN